MTKAQAEAKARSLWGTRAIINRSMPFGKDAPALYDVGMKMLGFFSVQGSGSSWEEAFEAAEKKFESNGGVWI